MPYKVQVNYIRRTHQPKKGEGVFYSWVYPKPYNFIIPDDMLPKMNKAVDRSKKHSAVPGMIIPSERKPTDHYNPTVHTLVGAIAQATPATKEDLNKYSTVPDTTYFRPLSEELTKLIADYIAKKFPGFA